MQAVVDQRRTAQQTIRRSQSGTEDHYLLPVKNENYEVPISSNDNEGKPRRESFAPRIAPRPDSNAMLSQFGTDDPSYISKGDIQS